jgi:hypothetical protein
LADLRDEPLVLPSQQTLPGLSAVMRAAFRQAKITPASWHLVGDNVSDDDGD